MEVILHFKNDSITPCKYSKGSSNVHSVRCQGMQYLLSIVSGLPDKTPVIRLSFSPADLLDRYVQMVVLNRELNAYADSRQKFIEIPCDELYDASARSDAR